ncbi:putative methionine--tRNA ligase [Lupinus albus]|uniref:Putative methionine--tRNA ligase n=1 Tax=Lupinus albus TaxID=3870 RepID=A0A6A4QDD0_LUPAL|nr:putative methionine--tRNA ligase [Lupinus albus]
MYEQLGYSRDQFDATTWRDTKWGGLKGGQVMAQPKPIFAKIENQTEVEDNVSVKGKGRKIKQAQQVVGA